MLTAEETTAQHLLTTFAQHFPFRSDKKSGETHIFLLFFFTTTKKITASKVNFRKALHLQYTFTTFGGDR